METCVLRSATLLCPNIARFPTSTILLRIQKIEREVGEKQGDFGTDPLTSSSENNFTVMNLIYGRLVVF